jgi:acyl-coenzyme A thioesterase PaaI-like protein
MGLADVLPFSPKNISTSRTNVIRTAWDRLSPLPGGKRLFSKAVGMAAPYTSTIDARVEEVRVGYAAVSLPDRHAVRNHLQCIHAVALVNLVELTGNVALAYSLPDDARFIVAGISIEYLKKARGILRATSECPDISTSERREYLVPVRVWNRQGDEVARAELRTLVGPKKEGA